MMFNQDVNQIELFGRLSAWLTGNLKLDQNEISIYWKRLMADEAYRSNLEALLNKVVLSESLADFLNLVNTEQRNYCKGITFLWYTSELISAENLYEKELSKVRTSGDQAQYYNALIWKVIRAHPPGLSGGYYGYWKYEPEN